MENTYRVGVTNRYELFCDDIEDPFDILEQADKIQKLQLEKAKQDGAKGPKVSSAGDDTKKESGGLGDNDELPSKGDGKFVQKSFDKGSKLNKSSKESTKKVEDKNRKNRNEPSDKISGPAPADRSEMWNEPGKARAPPRTARGRGGMFRGRDGFNERGKREFDRQSGSAKSGVKPVEKRDGGGAHNWGRANDDLEATRETTEEDRNPEEVALDSAELKVGVDHSKGETETEREMTLDEWKKQQKGARSVPTYNLRKPGEGEDNSQWGKFYQLKKKIEDGDDHSDEEEDDGAHRGRQKHQLKAIEIKFGDGGTRGRGAGRGARGSGQRAPKRIQPSASLAQSDVPNPLPQQPAPRFDDMNDFPSLSKN